MLKLGVHPTELDTSRVNSGDVEFRPKESCLGVKKVVLLCMIFFLLFHFVISVSVPSLFDGAYVN